MSILKSVWYDYIKPLSFPALDSNKRTDVLIIGGGIAGILCAYFLHKANIDYILAEADTICAMTTQNTTAKITAQHGFVYSGLIKLMGAEKAGKYLQANTEAVEMYRHLCKNIDCDFENKINGVYSVNDKDIISRELSALKQLNFSAQYDEKPDIPLKTQGAVVFPDQAQFNPMKFIFSIASGLNIFEHTRIVSVSANTAYTDSHTITAKKIIIATHFPFINRHGSYFLKMYQQRSYVIAYENAPDINGMYIDGSGNGLSFRNYKDLLLIGGGGHRTGMQGKNWCAAEDFARKHLPQASEKYRWSTQDCMTLDSMPYIGRYSALTPRLFVTAGYNKWGMTQAMASALLLTDLMLGKDNIYTAVFSPSRSILTKQTVINIFTAVRNTVSFSEKRCSHMGCVLKKNKAEHSWDCPCHGSRFTQDGKVLNNPAAKDLKQKPDDLRENTETD